MFVASAQGVFFIPAKLDGIKTCKAALQQREYSNEDGSVTVTDTWKALIAVNSSSFQAIG